MEFFRSHKKSLTGSNREIKDNNEATSFRCPLQCQINMNLVFHISEDGSEIELKQCIFRAFTLDKTR